ALVQRLRVQGCAALQDPVEEEDAHRECREEPGQQAAATVAARVLDDPDQREPEPEADDEEGGRDAEGPRKRRALDQGPCGGAEAERLPGRRGYFFGL